MNGHQIAVVVRGGVEDRFSEDYHTYASQSPEFTDDDLILVDALRRRGHTVHAAGWSDETVEWESFDLIVIRSPWGFFFDLPRFFHWLERLEKLPTRVVNSPEILRANVSKRYLLTLAEHGITTLPTRLVAQGQSVDLPQLAATLGAQQFVIKPASLGGAIDVSRAPLELAATLQASADEILRTDDLLVQEFFPEIEAGELSLVFFGTEFSHAVLKTPKQGEWKEQAQYGGTALACLPPDSLIEQAARARALLAPESVYARVDGFERKGKLYINECELIDPRLFFGTDPQAAERLVTQLERLLPP